MQAQNSFGKNFDLNGMHKPIIRYTHTTVSITSYVMPQPLKYDHNWSDLINKYCMCSLSNQHFKQNEDYGMYNLEKSKMKFSTSDLDVDQKTKQKAHKNNNVPDLNNKLQ